MIATKVFRNKNQKEWEQPRIVNIVIEFNVFFSLGLFGHTQYVGLSPLNDSQQVVCLQQNKKFSN